MSEETEETEGWGWYLVTLASTILVKIGMNYVVPGSGGIVDIIKAANDYRNGDKVGCVINIISGVSEIVTFGIASYVKEAVRRHAKKAIVNVAKKEVKSLVKKEKKKIGKILGKRLATGTIAAGGKPAAIQEAKELAKTAAKGAKKQVGEKYRKEIGKGVVSKATEEVMFQGEKLTVSKMPEIATTELFSNGLRLDKDLVQSSFESISAKTAEDLFTGFTKASYKNMCPTILNVAKTGAEEEFKKHNSKFFASNLGFGILKGVVKESGREDRDPQFPLPFQQENTSFSFPKSTFFQTLNTGREDQKEKTSFSSPIFTFSDTLNTGREDQEEKTSFSSPIFTFSDTLNTGREDQEEKTSFPFPISTFSPTLNTGWEDQQENTSFSSPISTFSHTLNTGSFSFPGSSFSRDWTNIHKM